MWSVFVFVEVVSLASLPPEVCLYGWIKRRLMPSSFRLDYRRSKKVGVEELVGSVDFRAGLGFKFRLKTVS